jgi:serine/threonine-protein kinase ULK/ATG1
MKCFDVVKETSHCYVITELCNGGDLGEMLKKKGRFTEVETHKILKDIVKAYIEIGHKGFLHRDLKLANVLMNNGHAKIADFGFAKKCKSQSIK